MNKIKNDYVIDHRIERSVQVDKFDFPDRNDYENYLVSKGYVANPSEIYNNDQMVIAMQRHWQAQGQSGCVYAQLAATNAEKLGWETNVINKSITQIETDSVTISHINELFQKSIRSPNCEAISFLFPQIVTMQDIAKLTQVMQQLEGWSSNVSIHEDKAIIGLRAELPEATSSWVVGFGPSKSFALTRQAPITEITARVKLKPEARFHRLNHKQGVAHLADIPLGLNDKIMERLWDATYLRVNQILGDTPRVTAAAKVTYVLPLEFWNNNKGKFNEEP